MCRPDKVKCFKCFKWFDKKKSQECKKCGDFKCPHCNSCMCNLSKKEKRVALAMIYTYENFINEKLGLDYNFSKHEEIEKEIN